MKKIISFLLSLTILLTTIPTFVSATTEAMLADINGNEYYAEATNVLNKLKIIEGYPDGSFKPEKSVTRAEMAAIVCRMIGIDEKDKKKDEVIFKDVNAEHWANGYISIASERDIINGYGNGIFRPDADVKYEEAIKMVICALNIGDNVKISYYDWSAGYLKIANEKGIIDNLRGSKGKPATRGDIAVMVYNGLTSNLVAPVTSKEEGVYFGTQEIQLSTTTNNAEIYYTTDGSTPTIKSEKYKKSIYINKTTTLKAVTVVNNILISDVMEVKYTIKNSSSSGNSSTKYIISFNTDGGNEIPDQTIPFGETATEPEEPEKSGYTFMGWLDQNDEYFDFSEAITENIALKAEWIKTIHATESIINKLEQKYIDDEVNLDIKNDTITNVDVDYKLDGIGSVGIAELTSDPMLRTAGLIGKPVEINASGADVIEATITFHYNSSKINEPDDLAIVWFDEENNIVKLLENSKVDINNNSVSTATTHFSKYGVVLRKIWDAAWNTQLSAVRTDNTPYYDILLAMDCSGSMRGDKMRKSIESAQNLIDILTDEDIVSVLSFTDYTKEIVNRVKIGEISLTGNLDNRTYVKNRLATLYASGGTNINTALNYAANNKIADIRYQSLVILLSDGQSYVASDVLDRLKSNSQKVITVGIGSDVDQSLMQKIATSTGGSYLYCKNAKDLADAFIDLQNTYIGSTVDTDGDGLPDLVESTGMRDQYGEIWTTDPKSADSDGDGISDREEMGDYNALAAHPYFNRVSRPDLYTVKSDEAYVLMPETMSHSFINGENKIKLMVYITDCGYRTVPDLLTPMEEDGIPKEYIYSPVQNLKAELINIPDGFTLDSIEIIEEGKSANGHGKDYQAIATLSYFKTADLGTVTWRITADNLSEWSGYVATGIKANYVEKQQKIEPNIIKITNEQLENELQKIAAQSKKLFEILYENSSEKADKSGNIKEKRKKFKQQLEAKYDWPDQVYDAIAADILDNMSEKIDKYETDMIKLTNQIYESLSEPIHEGNIIETVGNIQYKVNYQLFSYGGIGTSFIEIQCGQKKEQLAWTNANTDDGRLAIAEYCAALAQLNTDLWKEFTAYYFENFAKLTEIKKITKDNVSYVLNCTEKTIKAICDKKDANELIKEMGTDAENKLKSKFTNSFKKYVKNNVPDGKKIVDAAEKYEKVKIKYEKLKKLWEENSASNKTINAYENFATVYNELEEAVKAVNQSN